MSELPSGWTRCALGDLAAYVTSGSRDWSKYYSTEGALFVRTENINQNRLGSLADIARVALPDSVEGKRTLIKQGDLLITITGANVGKCAYVDLDIPEAYVSQSVALVRLVDISPARFIHRQLIAPGPAGDRTLLQQSAYGLGRPVLNLDNVREVPLVLAPASEQKRIADKLDAVLARVDACRERLDRVPAILKRFRQAVLAAATSGKLTKEWREERGWDMANWENSTVGQLIDRIEAGLNVQCEERPPGEGERGLVKISAVTWGTYDDNESKTLPPSKQVPEATRIRAGDFLISRANTLELVGACVIVHKVTRPVFLSDKVLRLVMPDNVKRWLLFFLQSESGRKQIEHLASGNQLSMRNLSQENLRSIAVLVSQEDEREEIVRRIESLFAYAGRLEARYAAARAQVERLTPALLAKAFRGELVPQDPNDEPAAVLLERIRTAREAAPAKSRQRKGSSQPSKTQKAEVTMLNRKDIQDALSR